ncbi:epidermal growth factor receptor substrate 15-like 1 isoform X2 [Rhopalosiphum padi]|uniref:epidermal growth factor receptor substrate 15-like 1 isoform X2 n=1 Tax=Rhopalosiphum padi TaxID=40932 RepID=UPI00298EC4AE|nr:epidermal growth factor receptor substrate 15-like 1 isoform X2 [Rhopalosiphum padi]
MATLPSPNEVAGSHFPIYEALYNMVDPTNKGNIGAMDAANFLKKSGLSQVILSQIWDLSDPTAKGFLTKQGFFVALKLIALAQTGREISMLNITQQTTPPNMGEASKHIASKVTTAGLVTAVTNMNDWSMKPSERMNYDKMFESLRPVNGTVAGDKVKGLLIDSKLSVDTLGKIWDLADMDKDGKLDQHEFAVAMHLVYKALEKYAIPSVLPTELLPPAKRKGTNMGISPVPVLPVLSSGVTSNLVKQPPKRPITPSIGLVPLPATWVVTVEEKSRYDSMFLESDVDMDGFVSGPEIKDRFLKTGIHQSILAHIWSLCDINQHGKLDMEQFSLAMWLVERKLKGVDPPNTLSPEMVPPSNRTVTPSNAVQIQEKPPMYTNPELDMIQKDIDELVKERLILETEIAQKEADLKIRSGEVKSLQGELDTLSATLKQLENQKGEAQKRLNDLRNQVDNLRKQADEQELTLKVQEADLSTKKQELEELKTLEHKLEKDQAEMGKRLDELNNVLQNSQLQISQFKNKVNQLEENKRQMEDTIESTEKALAEGNVYAIPDSLLTFNLEFRDLECSRLLGKIVDNKNSFENVNGFTPTSGASGSRDENSFKTDFFGNNDAFSTNNKTETFSNDPFTSFDDSRTRSQSTDPFGGETNVSKLSDRHEDKDEFGCDPFAILHAPTRPSSAPPPQRPESPTPALPPKKGKQPPPRPAPPRPAPYHAPTSHNSSSTSSEFADFANFSNKFSQNIRTEPKAVSQSHSFEFTEDPFKDYRYEDPFKIDPFSDTGFETDPFGDGAFSSDESQKVNFSDEQLAWEAQKKFRMEEEKARLEQEKADFELALRLSKATSSDNRSKILL